MNPILLHRRYVSVALSSRSPALGVTQQVWSFGSPDFPQTGITPARNRQRLLSPYFQFIAQRVFVGGLCGNLERWWGVWEKRGERRCGFLVSPAPRARAGGSPSARRWGGSEEEAGCGGQLSES